MTAHAFLDGLDPAQLHAATAPLGPLCVLAGPGAGKTRTVVARIAHVTAALDVDPGNVLALSHTTKAAGELRDRVAAGAPHATTVTSSTIHAAAWYQLRHLASDAGFAVPTLLPSTYNQVRAAAETVHRRRIHQTELLDLVSELDWARARLLTPDRYAACAATFGRTAPTGEFELVARTWDAYRELKVRDGLADFADVLDLARVMLDDPAIARRVRGRWQVFFVDEYQDVDPAQQALLDAWLGGSGALTVVGDPNQAIYGFKGGDPSLLTGFAHRYPGAVVVELTANFRSTPQVVDWVNRVRTVPAAPLEGRRPDGPAPRVEFHGSERDETAALVAQVRAWTASGIAPEEIAVLYRFNSAAARVEAAFTAAGVNYSVLGASRFFDRSEIRALLAELTRLVAGDPHADAFETVQAAARRCGWDPDSPPDGVGASRARFEALDAVVTLVGEQMNALSASMCERELARRARDAHEPSLGGVRLGTIHAAKGLEWSAVWVLGVVEGQMPSAYAKTDAQLAEEQNALYVAVSRAKELLVLSVPSRSTNNWTLKPSRFLDLLAGRRTPPRSGTRPAPHPAARASSVRRPGRPDGERPSAAPRPGRSRRGGVRAERDDSPVLRPRGAGEFTCSACFLIRPDTQLSRSVDGVCRDCE